MSNQYKPPPPVLPFVGGAGPAAHYPWPRSQNGGPSDSGTPSGRWRYHGGGGGGSPTAAGGGRRGGATPSSPPQQGGRFGRGVGSNTPPSSTLHYIRAVTGDPLTFNETNMDWNRLNIFRTRLCDRLTQMNTCHMANRCLFSHDMAWPRRTPFLPRATAPTLRYIPVWCPRLQWPPLAGICDSMGKINWSSLDSGYDPRFAHNGCVRGDNCPFVHNLEEFLYHPEVYKTRMCCLANDEHFGEERGDRCTALCPWYFCPFAHYLSELRDVRSARYTWHQPPQIVDNHYVARTQGFDDVELSLIRYVRSHSSLDLYGGGTGGGAAVDHHIRCLVFGRYSLLPPVFRPIEGSSLEHLAANDWHREIEFDDLLYFMIMASLMNLLLYPVENFYIPALLSLQCASLEYQLGPAAAEGGSLDCSQLLAIYDQAAAHEEENERTERSSAVAAAATTTAPAEKEAPEVKPTPPQPAAVAPTTDAPQPAAEEEATLESILNTLAPEELLKVFQLFAAKNAAANAAASDQQQQDGVGSDKTTDASTPSNLPIAAKKKVSADEFSMPPVGSGNWP